MKKSLRLLSFLSLFLMLGLSSCKDECDDVNCQNGGTCNDGNCSCAAGYEGSECQTEQRAKFIGAYNVSESCSESGNFTFQKTISPSGTGVSNIIINNIYDSDTNVSGTVNGAAVTIPNQTNNVGGISVTFSGSGQIAGSILTLTYTVSGGGFSETCTATCVKQ